MGKGMGDEGDTTIPKCLYKAEAVSIAVVCHNNEIISVCRQVHKATHGKYSRSYKEV